MAANAADLITNIESSATFRACDLYCAYDPHNESEREKLPYPKPKSRHD